jgi:hypothetical protein
MEFERAIYRVYERSVEGLIHDDDPERANDPVQNKTCRLFEVVLLMLGFTTLFMLHILHGNFVGQTGCLKPALMFYNDTTNRTELYKFRKDEILGINIADELIEKAIGPVHKNDDYTHDNDDFSLVPDYFRKRHQKSSLRSTSSYPSFHHEISQFPQLKLLSNPFARKSPINLESWASFFGNKKFTDQSISSVSANNRTASNTTNSDSSSNSLDYDFDYIVTFHQSIALMEMSMIQSHHFHIINVTLYGAQCFGGNSLQTLVAIAGIDTAILNNVISTIQLPGYMISKRGSVYHWTHEHYQRPNTFSTWFVWKLSMFIESLWSFFLLSTTTALLVRVLISSGVIIIFPIFWCLQQSSVQ